MEKNIVWLRLALNDIEQIRSDYTEAVSEEIANKQTVKIVKAARLLQMNPYVGHVSDLDYSGEVLEWVIPKTHFILPYLVRDEDVVILRVFDTRQDRPESWV